MADVQLEIDIPVEEVDVVLNDDGSMPVEPEDVVVLDNSFDANLAERLPDSMLTEIGEERQEIYRDLKNSRSDWEEGIKQGIQWLGVNIAGQSAGGDSETATGVDGACTAVHPLLIENVVKFQAKAIQELWPAKGPVRTKIKGFVNDVREQAASRVRAYMNYQLTEQCPGFYADLERNLFRVGFMGTGIRKAGWSAALGSPDPVTVYAENFFVAPGVNHLKDADEYIEVMEFSPRKMDNLVASGVFLDHEDSDSEETLTSNDVTLAIQQAQGFDELLERRGYLMGEAHCYLDLGGEDELAEGMAPYVVHFNVNTGKVYSIRRNWREDDENRVKRLWYTVDVLIPGLSSIYGYGYVHLVGNLTAAVSAALRALVDSGQYNNWQGGFKSKRAKFSDGEGPIGFGEFRDVDLDPEDLAKAFVVLPTREPSQALFQMMQFMVASGQKFADATDEVAQNGTNYGPVATTLALLEASQRFYSAIHKRLHQSQGEFLRMLGELNYDHLPDRVDFVVNDENQFVSREDFNPAVVDVIPGSDPNAMSESQRLAKAEIELNTAAKFPQLHDMREALKRFYYAMGTESVDKLLVDPEAKAISADPLTEIKMAMTGKPIKAVMGQDHDAHIAVKTAFMQSPQMQGSSDPTIAVGVNLLKSNIAEHKALSFIAQVQMLAQQNGANPQDQKVQGLIAQFMLKQSAESGVGKENSEAKMIQLQERQLAIDEERIKSQEIRENAKMAQKDRELDLKQLQLQLDNQQETRKLDQNAATKILESSARAADNANRILADRVTI